MTKAPAICGKMEGLARMQVSIFANEQEIFTKSNLYPFQYYFKPQGMFYTLNIIHLFDHECKFIFNFQLLIFEIHRALNVRGEIMKYKLELEFRMNTPV